ncbi:MAG: chorismate mutase [Lautropia sp.]
MGEQPHDRRGHDREPDPRGAPLRAFADPAYRPLAGDLQTLRDAIDAIDRDLVALIARRAMYVKDAARFKADRHQVSAPERQAEVFARVRRLAREADLGFDGLEDVVDTTWRAMVAAFIAQEGRYFDDMRTLAPPSGAARRESDAPHPPKEQST